MRMLLIDDDVRGQIKKALKYAEEHIFTISQIKRIIESGEAAKKYSAGFNPEFVTHIHEGYRVVY
jgi:dUTPase